MMNSFPTRPGLCLNRVTLNYQIALKALSGDNHSGTQKRFQNNTNK